MPKTRADIPDIQSLLRLHAPETLSRLAGYPEVVESFEPLLQRVHEKYAGADFELNERLVDQYEVDLRDLAGRITAHTENLLRRRLKWRTKRRY